MSAQEEEEEEGKGGGQRACGRGSEPEGGWEAWRFEDNESMSLR